MKQVVHKLTIQTREQGFYEFTRELSEWVAAQGISTGLLTVFCRHTSASLTIQENADPDVRHDLQGFFDKLVPQGPGIYTHENEGLDDMPAHIKSTLTDVSLNVPVVDGRPVFGTWQGIFLYEHRARGLERQVVLHLLGE